MSLPRRDRRSRLQHPPESFQGWVSQALCLCSDWLLRKSQRDGCAAANLALDGGGSAVKIDNRFYQSQTKTCSIGAARRLGAVKSIKHTGQMFWSYSAAAIADCDFEISVVFGERNLNRTVLRSETQRVIEQISHGALEQVRIGVNLTFAAATDRDVTIVRDRLIKRCNFLHGCARIESLSRDRFARCVHSRNEKQIIHDSGEPFAFANRGLDRFTVFGSRAIPRKSNLRFAHHIGDGRSQLVGEVGRKLREPRERIVEALEHVI